MTTRRHERFAARMARKYARLCRKAERVRKAGVAALERAGRDRS